MDIIIPVYNEKENIRPVLYALKADVKTPFKVLICYDMDEDNTLPAVKEVMQELPFNIQFIKNKGVGVHSAITTGFGASNSDIVLVYPADDDYNAKIIDEMHKMASSGYDIVAASRFMKGGTMVGAPALKGFLVRLTSAVLYYLARLPVRDASNGFRMFSRRVIDQIELESKKGFTYSIEFLVKAHRIGWKIGEVPASWFDRKMGKSRFKISKWAFDYLRWFFYAFATTYLKKNRISIKIK